MLGVNLPFKIYLPTGPHPQSLLREVGKNKGTELMNESFDHGDPR